MQVKRSSPLAELLLGLFIMSTSGPLGRYILLPPPAVIWIRSAIGFVFLYFLCRWLHINLKFDWKKAGGFLVFSSIILGVHWSTYFYALQYSSVAMAMLSLFTYPVITALLEPLVFSTGFTRSHLINGSLIMIGLYFLVPEFSLQDQDTIGILFGLAASVLWAIRNLWSKKHIVSMNGAAIMMYQLLGVTLFFWPFLFMISDGQKAFAYWPTLLTLGILTTAIAHSIFVHSLRYFSVASASIISGLQPLFGIILAYFFLDEIPTLESALGGLIILTGVILESWAGYRRKKTS